jgi:uncharacterized protein YfcZ (UPF0381/DUF406 family)
MQQHTNLSDSTQTRISTTLEQGTVTGNRARWSELILLAGRTSKYSGGPISAGTLIAFLQFYVFWRSYISRNTDCVSSVLRVLEVRYQPEHWLRFFSSTCSGGPISAGTLIAFLQFYVFWRSDISRNTDCVSSVLRILEVRYQPEHWLRFFSSTCSGGRISAGTPIAFLQFYVFWRSDISLNTDCVSSVLRVLEVRYQPEHWLRFFSSSK